MKKLTLLTGALLALTLAVAGGFSNPQAAWAICYCNPEEPYSETSPFWGKGTTCQAAIDHLRSYTSADAYQACGSATRTCLGDLVVNYCIYDYSISAYLVGGYQYYKCKECTTIEPREPITP